ncbi:Uncharacterised protein [Salmonella enterica]|uniref:Uncharacterized protein n=1 Tax=Salmonella enterica TaxID=28901 RepID=A0A379SHJ8_SALER|nr:Uncharacterised protein [Salmonella enterica]
MYNNLMSYHYILYVLFVVYNSVSFYAINVQGFHLERNNNETRLR